MADNGIPFLTQAEIERLSLLSEELGEGQQAIGKILRHGYESRYPHDGPSNRDRLMLELGHVEAAIRLLAAAEDIERGPIHYSAVEKLKKVAAYLHHQPYELLADAVRAWR